MDVKKVYDVCREIARKTKAPKEGFTPKEERFLHAHQELWLTMIYDAFGVDEEEVEAGSLPA